MKKTYKITFYAELDEEDVRAMNGCFYQAMNESMEIEEVYGLEIEQAGTDDDYDEEPTEYKHINDCVGALMQCKTKAEVEELFDSFPRKFGDWWIDVVDLGDEPYYEVTNEYWDEQYEELCSNQYELEIPVEEDDL